MGPFVVRLSVFVAVALGFHVQGQAASRQELAASFVQLYFSAPLLTKQLQESGSWQRHAPLSAEDAQALVPIIWNTYRSHHRKSERHGFAQRLLVLGDDRMAFTLERHGPNLSTAKLPVTISLHGGGAGPKKDNDRQWQLQQLRYPAAPGLYVCPRAPRDTWNQWHAEYVAPLIDQLIQELLIHENVDPDRVYLTGYSAGAYGAFHLGANMADRFAAVAASAGAPIPASTPAEHWRNLPLRFEIGEKDVAYGRVTICREYERALNNLRRQDQDAFPFVFIEHKHQSHQLADHGSARWLGAHRRRQRPAVITWIPSEPQTQQFYWLANDEPAPGQRIHARIKENQITMETVNVRRLRLRLDDRLVDLEKPVTVSANGMKLFEGRLNRELQCLVRTLEERGDPELMFCSEIALYIP